MAAWEYDCDNKKLMVYSGNQEVTSFSSKVCLRDVATVYKYMPLSTLLFTFPKVYHQLVVNLINIMWYLYNLRGILPLQEHLAIQSTEFKKKKKE